MSEYFYQACRGFTYYYKNGSRSVITENIFTNTVFYKLFRVKKYC